MILLNRFLNLVNVLIFFGTLFITAGLVQSFFQNQWMDVVITGCILILVGFGVEFMKSRLENAKEKHSN